MKPLSRNLKDFAAKNEAAGYLTGARLLHSLNSEDNDASTIRSWLQKHPPNIDEKGLEAFDPLDRAIIRLVEYIVCFEPADSWERLSTEDRDQHGSKVASLAHRLADALDEAPHSYYGKLADYCHSAGVDAIAVRDLILDEGEELSDDDLDDLSEEYDRRDDVIVLSNGSMLNSKKLAEEKLSSLLRNLAKHALLITKKSRRASRFSNPDRTNSQIFAKYIDTYLRQTTSATSNAVIAACMALYDPHSEATAQTVKSWRRSW